MNTTSAFFKGIAACALVVLLGYGVTAWATGTITGVAGGGTAVSISSGTVDTVTTVSTVSAITPMGATSDAAATAGSTGSVNAKLRLLTNLTLDPCASVAKVSVPINIATGTTTVLVAASASNKVYICSLNIGPTAGAQNAALIEDATGSCASPDAGMAGGTTAGSGWNIAANGGLAWGSGAGTIAKTASTNVNVCLITSASQQTSGVLTYALAP